MLSRSLCRNGVWGCIDGFARTLLLLIVFAISGCALPPKTEAEGPAGQITKGPCLLRVCPDRAALMWETNAPGRCGVSYGLPGRPDTYRERTAESITCADSADRGQKTAYVHKVWIEGLQPGRAYRYRITGPKLHSETFEFRTTPARTDEVRFIVYGDSRTQVRVHRRLIEQMMKQDVDFIVHGGDLVSRGDDYPQWGPQFFEPLKGLMERVPIYIVKGNHEGQNGTYEKLLAPLGEGNGFALVYGPLCYLGLDNVSRGRDDGRLLRQVVDTAGASRVPWKFVSYHVPSVNFGGHWSDWRQSDVLAAFAGAGIDFAITAHSHQYERFRPVESREPGQCVTYLTAGGGGAPLYPVAPTAYHACAKTAHHFCLFHLKGGHLTMDAIDPNGRVFDHVEITKREGRVDEQYRATAVPAGSIRLHHSLHQSLNMVPSGMPSENQPCTLGVRLAVPRLDSEVKLTFTLRGDSQDYQLPEPHAVTVGGKGGPVRAELMFTPKRAVHVATGTLGQAAPLEPALWLDCRYEYAGVEETISRSVTIKGPSLLEQIIGTRD